METKLCSKCGKEKELDRFDKNKACASGYVNTCKDCKNKRRKEIYNGAPKLKDLKSIPKAGYKFCSKCGEEKPINEFREKRNKCKICTNIDQIDKRKAGKTPKYIPPEGYRVCNECGEEKEIKFFVKRRNICKKCQNKINREELNSKHNYYINLIPKEGYKFCCRCGKEKLLEEFSQNKRHEDGLTYYCKECYTPAGNDNKKRESNKIKGHEYYEKNKEQIHAINRKYYEENKDKIKITQTVWVEKQKIAGIYKITNIINGKCYIGQSINLNIRLRIHLWSLKKNQHASQHLQNAVNKYGIESFSFEVIEKIDIKNIKVLLFTESLLSNREQYWCDYYKSSNRHFGYNIREVVNSNLGHVMSDEQRKLIGDRTRGRKISEEHKRILSEANKGRKHTLGKVMSVEEKIKRSNKNATDDIVLLIRGSALSTTQLGEMFNLNPSLVSKIKRREAHSWVEDEV